MDHDVALHWLPNIPKAEKSNCMFELNRMAAKSLGRNTFFPFTVSDSVSHDEYRFASSNQMVRLTAFTWFCRFNYESQKKKSKKKKIGFNYNVSDFAWQKNCISRSQIVHIFLRCEILVFYVMRYVPTMS